MKTEAHVATDIGRLRMANEDAHLVRPDVNLYAVADGMGGHAAGEVASHLAIEIISQSANSSQVSPKELPRFLKTQFARANDAIRTDARKNPEHEGMGTTLTVLIFSNQDGQASFAHVGDSRLYRCRSGRLEQLTRDHTWVQEQLDQGALTPDQARLHPLSSMLNRALGIQDSTEVDIGSTEVRPGDKFLLCSDGLSNMLPDPAIERILRKDETTAALADALVTEANARGGSDNITAVVVLALG